MVKPDFKLIAAFVVPLLILPFVPPWNAAGHNNGRIGTIALFLLIPVAEEIVFRGFLQGGLLRNIWFRQTLFGFSKANQFTSVVFAAAHLWQHPPFLLPGYFVVSLVLGYFRERFGGILVPVLLHSYYNLGLWVFAE